MWFYIFLGMTVGAILGGMYLVTRFAKSSLLLRAVKGNRFHAILIGLLVVLVVAGIIDLLYGFWNLAVILIHLLLFFGAADAMAWIVSRFRRKQRVFYAAGLLALVSCLSYLGVGVYYAHHVVETHYEVKTYKDIGGEPLRIVGFSDAHLGATFHWKKFETYIDRINKLEPDLVVIAGDYVDQFTTEEDMVRCCAALSKLETTYGVFYIWGNHDMEYDEAREGYNTTALIQELEANGVTVLEDEVVPLRGVLSYGSRVKDEYDVGAGPSTGGVCLAGRMDKKRGKPAHIRELLDDVPYSVYTIVVNHRPQDYHNEAISKADLVISGHTHGGQLFPLTLWADKLSDNDFLYGYTHRKNTDFIVSSGISDSEFIFKTGCVSEYFVIDVVQIE